MRKVGVGCSNPPREATVGGSDEVAGSIPGQVGGVALPVLSIGRLSVLLLGSSRVVCDRSSRALCTLISINIFIILKYIIK